MGGTPRPVAEAEKEACCYVCCAEDAKTNPSPCPCNLEICDNCLGELQKDSEKCTVCRTEFTRKVARPNTDEILVVVRATGSSRCNCGCPSAMACCAFLVGLGILLFATIIGMMWADFFHKDFEEMETGKRIGLTFGYGIASILIASIFIACCAVCFNWGQPRRVHVI